MKASMNERCLFINGERMKIIVLIHVDDLLCAGTDDMINIFEKFMESKFQLKFILVADTYVALKLFTSGQSSLSSVAHHFTRGFIRHQLEVSKNKLTTPLANELNSDSFKILFNKKQYKQVVVIINYVTQHERPEVA
eukprot:snap_masked-scaffold_23-processed-gene-2.42-mRNA-1 protein AED:1.00 eAED:1.00 QI:0/-1/0/0/-1/1/1/0/136